ncbi:hypothetical protein PM082_017728 [Marasmius tenuissimus]|nr:hypothetical protein PM082_017728 [Marasmius tenuissimus]
MHSGAGKVERPHDGLLSQASTWLEGNGRGFGVPALQIDILGTTLSKGEYCVTTFHAVDLNKNTLSGDEGGDLMKFIRAIQGVFHVDFHNNHCCWMMLVVMIKLPPGSDPGAFILACFSFYVKFKLMPNGCCIFFLFFKGSDLHLGVAPTVHPLVCEAALAELAEHINKAKPVNHVVYIYYPSQ